MSDWDQVARVYLHFSKRRLKVEEGPQTLTNFPNSYQQDKPSCFLCGVIIKRFNSAWQPPAELQYRLSTEKGFRGKKRVMESSKKKSTGASLHAAAAPVGSGSGTAHCRFQMRRGVTNNWLAFKMVH